ncbi:hypothetical protein M3Y99_01822700 [Aphelenchoides fujianensis]|nr:hypothetical protein M3Y99_01822700 [Aphelenchoides fujianensis]
MYSKLFLSLLVAALVVEMVVACDPSPDDFDRRRRSADQPTITVRTSVKSNGISALYEKIVREAVEFNAIVGRPGYVQQDQWIDADGNFAFRGEFSNNVDCGELRRAVQKMKERVLEITSAEVDCNGQQFQV